MGVTSRKPAAHEVAEAIGRVEGIDAVGDPLARRVSGALGNGALKDLLSGVPLGHPLHPLYDRPAHRRVDERHAARPPGRQARAPGGRSPRGPRPPRGGADRGRRALGLGRHDRGRAPHRRRARGGERGGAHPLRGSGWRAGADGAASGHARPCRGGDGCGADLAGHRPTPCAVGVDQTALEDGPGRGWPRWPRPSWPRGARARERGGHGRPARAPGRARARPLGHVLAPRRRPAEGTLEDGCVVCPLHGSRFRLEDGSVERGPATYPQPRWESRR